MGNLRFRLHCRKIVFFNWHNILCHASKKYIQKLARIGCLPKGLEKVSKIHSCTTCTFSDTSKRNYRSKGGTSSLRKTTDKRGSNRSCDDLIWHGSRSIPRVTGRLTYEEYAGAVIFSDDCTDFM